MGKSLLAATVEKELDKIEDEYVIVYDQCLTGAGFDNLNKAINLMAKNGWECIGFTTSDRPGGFGTAFYAHALMKRT